MLRSIILYLVLSSVLFTTGVFAPAEAVTITNDRVFAYAEANYPKLFPGTAADQQFQQYSYRYYPASANYLAVDTANVIFMLGSDTGNVLTNVGSVASFADAIIAWEASAGVTSQNGVTATVVRGTSIAVSWANTCTVCFWQLSTQQGNTPWVIQKELPKGSTQYTIANLPAGQKLSVKLAAKRAARWVDRALLTVTTGFKSQAGFIEIEPIGFSLHYSKAFLPYTDTSSTARVLYTFHPATQNPDSKPLFVFLNGGPGCATTTNLFSMNTAPFTLDRERTNGSTYATNPYSWSVMGNLLYIDAPNTGFSYNVTPGAVNWDIRFKEFNSNNFNPFIDSANVVRVLLRFLDAHPSLRSHQVVLVGESYSGTRVSTMLNLLLFYTSYGTGEKIYQDTALAAEIGDHLAKVFPAQADAGSVPPTIVARQFGRQILIQPEISGPYQAQVDGDFFEQPNSIIDQLASETGTIYNRCNPKELGCNKEMNALIFVESIALRDRYNLKMHSGWTDELEAFAMKSLLNVDILSSLFNFYVPSIGMFYKTERYDGYRYITDKNELDSWTVEAGALSQKEQLLRRSQERLNQLLGDSSANSMEDVFGTLPVYDDYLSGTNLAVFNSFMFNKAVLLNYPISPDESPLFGQLFLENATLVKTFLTDAESDLVIYSPGYSEALKKYSSIVNSVSVNRGSRQQPIGSFRINYVPNSLIETVTPSYVDLYYPYYPDSGHSVSSAQPDKLLQDIKNWLGNSI